MRNWNIWVRRAIILPLWILAVIPWTLFCIFGRLMANVAMRLRLGGNCPCCDGLRWKFMGIKAHLEVFR